MNREIRDYIDGKFADLEKRLILELRSELRAEIKREMAKNDNSDNREKTTSQALVEVGSLKKNLIVAFEKLNMDVEKRLKPLEETQTALNARVMMLQKQNIDGEEILHEYNKKFYNKDQKLITNGKGGASRSDFGNSSIAFSEDF